MGGNKRCQGKRVGNSRGMMVTTHCSLINIPGGGRGWYKEIIRTYDCFGLSTVRRYMTMLSIVLIESEGTADVPVDMEEGEEGRGMALTV